MNDLFETLGTILKPNVSTEWQPIATAPKTGITIEVSYGDGTDESDNCDAFWSERPVCMAGNQFGGCKAGWATAGDKTDKNLPLDEPLLWRQFYLPPHQPAKALR